MASDVHAHPFDLLRIFPNAKTERRSLGLTCAASSCSKEEFLFNEELAAAAKKDGAPPLYLCFAVHPQMPAYQKKLFQNRENLDLLTALAAEGRITAVGETGFDLYSADYRETEKIQDELFCAHLEIALRYNLPLVLHVRRAMHKIFPYTKTLKRLPAVIFHSWPGVPEEGFSLLRRGIRAFFSFGTTLLLNHKKAIHSCAEFPVEHLLLETDAPYQPLQKKEYSSWADLPVILAEAANIRKKSGVKTGTDVKELEQIIDRNFSGIFLFK